VSKGKFARFTNSTHPSLDAPRGLTRKTRNAFRQSRRAAPKKEKDIGAQLLVRNLVLKEWKIAMEGGKPVKGDVKGEG